MWFGHVRRRHCGSSIGKSISNQMKDSPAKMGKERVKKNLEEIYTIASSE
jgi:hypothetical protein